MTTDLHEHHQLARSAASAAVGVLPAGEALTADQPQPGSGAVLDGFAGAVLADLEAPRSGRLAVLVGPELVRALESTPLGGLDLAAALQPSLDAIAGALGNRAGAARQVDPVLVLSDLGGPFTSVRLVGSQAAAAVLLPDAVLQAAAGSAGSTDSADPADPADPAHAAAAVAGPQAVPARPRGIELLHGVDMEVTVEIGRTRMTVRELLDLAPGAVLELDRAAGSPADLLVNGRLIARGEVVVIDEDFGLRITEIVVDAAAG
jgi:flagellar motor switch protein FliN